MHDHATIISQESGHWLARRGVLWGVFLAVPISERQPYFFILGLDRCGKQRKASPAPPVFVFRKKVLIQGSKAAIGHAINHH